MNDLSQILPRIVAGVPSTADKLLPLVHDELRRRLATHRLAHEKVRQSLQLAAHDPRAAELVKLRFFAGFAVSEAADARGVSNATAENDWVYAKSWLKLQLSTNEGTRP